MIGSKRISFFFSAKERVETRERAMGALYTRRTFFTIEKVLQNFFAFSFHF